MALATSREKPDRAEASAPREGEIKSPRSWRLGQRALIGISLVMFVIMLGVVMAWRSVGTENRQTISREIDLGDFSVAPVGPGAEQLSRVDLHVHICLLPTLDPIVSPRVELRRQRLIQGIEEIVRQVRVGDFEDPTHAALKRILQERLNQLLDFRALEEVVITRVKLHPTIEGLRRRNADDSEGALPVSAEPKDAVLDFTPGEASPLHIESQQAW